MKSHSLHAALVAAFCLLTTVGLQAQTVFVSDYTTGLITALPLAGGSSTFATAPGGAQPEGMAFDSAGNLYVAYAGTNTIQKFTPGGVGSLFGTTIVSGPTGLAFDSAGNLYVSMSNNGTIEKFGPGGGTSTVFATGFGPVLGLAIDGANNVYGASYQASGFIYQVGPGGGIPTAIASSLNYPNSLAFDGAGNLYATIGGTVGIQKYAAGTWTPSAFFTPIPSSSGPTGIVYDPGSATFFVSMISTGTIERYALNGADLGLFASGFTSASSIAISAVPEPSTFAALFVGVSALGFLAWSKRRKLAA